MRYAARNAVSAVSIVGSLLSGPVADAGDDHALQVVRDELHRVRDAPDTVAPFTISTALRHIRCLLTDR